MIYQRKNQRWCVCRVCFSRFKRTAQMLTLRAMLADALHLFSRPLVELVSGYLVFLPATAGSSSFKAEALCMLTSSAPRNSEACAAFRAACGGRVGDARRLLAGFQRRLRLRALRRGGPSSTCGRRGFRIQLRGVSGRFCRALHRGVSGGQRCRSAHRLSLRPELHCGGQQAAAVVRHGHRQQQRDGAGERKRRVCAEMGQMGFAFASWASSRGGLFTARAHRGQLYGGVRRGGERQH